VKGRRISILEFSSTRVRAGAEEHILTLLRGLDRERFRLYLVCTPELAEQLRPDVPDDVEMMPLRLEGPSQVSAALGFARILRERRVDILHSHMFRSSLVASPIGWLCRIPVIVETSHGREAWRRGWFKGRFVVDRWAGHFVDYYIAVSEANARYLVEQKGLPAAKITIIHNGCHLARLYDTPRASAGLKRDLGFEQEDPVLLLLGRLEPQKGHHVLLEAFPAVRREFPSARLVCVGEGTLLDNLERQVAALNLQGAVYFAGYQSNVQDWLGLADISVLPSLWEGLPLVAIESLAAGRALVATAVDGTPEIVVNERTGLTVPPGDAHQLAKAILRLLREPELRNRLGTAGRKWVSERFSREQQIEKTAQFYVHAWDRRARGITSRAPRTVVETSPVLAESFPSKKSPNIETQSREN
jgi:glycosyltransferase involved in cell wall biosynthesis